MVKQKYKGFSGCFELILKYYLYTADDNIKQKITLHMRKDYISVHGTIRYRKKEGKRNPKNMIENDTAILRLYR